MKKVVSALLAGVMAVSLTACSSGSGSSSKEGGDKSTSDLKVAMVTDSGEITDKSFNETTYEASKAWSEKNGVDFKYYKPAGNTNDERTQAIETAIAEGYTTITVPGYLFAESIIDISKEYPNVKLIALDMSENDILSAALGNQYDNDPSHYNLDDYYKKDNVYCAVYKEELCGYMAGYAAVKMGYTKLGFLGGMAVPAVIRYGKGYVQGAGDAAKELGLNDVEVNYAYAGKFTEDPQIKAVMDTWYSNGTQVVFGCGGRVYISACEAAQTVNGKLIGVDVDQKAAIDDAYGEGMCITSAMKGLAATINSALDSIKDGTWSSNFGGKIDTLGLVSGDDPSLNYEQLPDTTVWNDGFTQDDYKALVKKMFDGEITVGNDISNIEPESTSTVKVSYQGSILS